MPEEEAQRRENAKQNLQTTPEADQRIRSSGSVTCQQTWDTQVQRTLQAEGAQKVAPILVLR